MSEAEIKAILMESLENLGDSLRDAIVQEVLKGLDFSLSEWEQFREVKKRVDVIWREVKHCSERVIVSKRSEALKKTLDGLRPT